MPEIDDIDQPGPGTSPAPEKRGVGDNFQHFKSDQQRYHHYERLPKSPQPALLDQLVIDRRRDGWLFP